MMALSRSTVQSLSPKMVLSHTGSEYREICRPATRNVRPLMFLASSVQSQVTNGPMASGGNCFAKASRASRLMPAAPPRAAAAFISSLMVSRVAARGRMALHRTP